MAVPILLVIDDELGVRESLKMVFSSDFRVLEADSVEAALPQLETERPQVILLDVLLPRTDGIAVLKRIKEMDPGCEVIMLTAMQNRKVLDAASDFGAFDFVGKPFDIIDLRAKVNRALAKTVQSEREPVTQN
jgi:DNA-binding NtrC family response regulator